MSRSGGSGGGRSGRALLPRGAGPGSSRPRGPEPAATGSLPPPPLPLQPPRGPAAGSPGPGRPAELKPVRRFIPDSWKNFFKGRRTGGSSWDSAASDIRYISDGVECSPPASPQHRSVPGSCQDPCGGAGGSCGSRREAEAMLAAEPCGWPGRRAGSGRTPSERLEAYRQRHAFMKSWPGLLRILGVAQLLLGAAVFACVAAYVHKDNEWYNVFGYSQPYGYGPAGAYGGYSYSGPKTPFVLVAAGMAWVVTIVLLVLGMSMYYRTILLDSSWWPLTEFGINVALFLLYMSAAVVYVNDTNRGGLCYYQLFKTPINASFCRVEGGQTAAIIFLFVTVVMYLVSAVVSLKLWRHEAARRHRELMEREMKTQSSLPEYKYESEDRPGEEVAYRQLKSMERKPELLNGHIPAGHIPKPVVMPDYLAKYPAIQTNEMRDRYKAVFNDQFAEYKELSVEVHAVLKKFDELDALMRQLPYHPESIYEQERIYKVLQEYKKKKNDPAFLEKKERCEYLKNKLSHIKQRIQDYDKIMNWNVET
ncbi:MARVEL domain-containing protein 2 [Apus apus]|uniref:MARVEL domain-containing protein 2 n=1 Tax=Apus apus TaxID=8895 RepID=UPI0021F84C39|nr:MARVEL domain-containing protein 2 [Apus apus]